MEEKENDNLNSPKLVVVNSDIEDASEDNQEAINQQRENLKYSIKQPPTQKELAQGIEAPPDVIGNDVAPDGDEVSFSSYGVRRQSRGQELMLDLKFKDDSRLALSYIHLASMRFSHSNGILLDFTGVIVQVEGRNLRPIYTALMRHSVTFIREQDPLYDDEGRQTCFVAKICVREFA